MDIWIAWYLEWSLNSCLSPLFQIDIYFKLEKKIVSISNDPAIHQDSTSVLWERIKGNETDLWQQDQ